MTSIDKLRAGFESAITSSYDALDVLGAFLVYIDPLVKLEKENKTSYSERAIKEACDCLENAVASSLLEENLGVDEHTAVEHATKLFRDEGFFELARLLQLFLLVLDDRSSAPPPASCCEFIVTSIKCEECGNVSRHLFWRLINTTFRPELEILAANGDLCKGSPCLWCGSGIGVMLPFFYCNPSREEFIVYWPGDGHTHVESFADQARKALVLMAPDFTGGKTRFFVIRGTPIAQFKQDDVAAVTVIHTPDEFIRVVSEPVTFFVEPYDVRDMKAYFDGKGILATENPDRWKIAAKAFATSFTLNPAGVSRLEMLVPCLKNIGREEEANSIGTDAVRLRERLIKEDIIRRICRPSIPSGAAGTIRHLQILKSGLPNDWGFSRLVDAVTRISMGN